MITEDLETTETIDSKRAAKRGAAKPTKVPRMPKTLKEEERQKSEERKKEEREIRVSMIREENERITKEIQEKVGAAVAAVGQPQNSATLPPPVSNPFHTTSVQKRILLRLADNGVYYEGKLVASRRRGTFGFILLDSPPLTTSIFVHRMDILNPHRRFSSGTRLRFQLTKSLKKPGKVKAVKATIL